MSLLKQCKYLFFLHTNSHDIINVVWNLIGIMSCFTLKSPSSTNTYLNPSVLQDITIIKQRSVLSRSKGNKRKNSPIVTSIQLQQRYMSSLSKGSLYYLLSSLDIFYWVVIIQKAPAGLLCFSEGCAIEYITQNNYLKPPSYLRLYVSICSLVDCI